MCVCVGVFVCVRVRLKIFQIPAQQFWDTTRSSTARNHQMLLLKKLNTHKNFHWLCSVCARAIAHILRNEHIVTYTRRKIRNSLRRKFRSEKGCFFREHFVAQFILPLSMLCKSHVHRVTSFNENRSVWTGCEKFTKHTYILVSLVLSLCLSRTFFKHTYIHTITNTMATEANVSSHT